MVRFKRFLLVTVALGVLGCSPPGVMVHVPPPSSWEGELADHRAWKDRMFATDPESPLLEEDHEDFAGLDYWEPDSRYRLVGPLQRYSDPKSFDVVTTRGTVRPCERYGFVEFDLDGQRLRLQVYRLLDAAPQPGSTGLFLPFLDTTSGEQTYSAGRYLDLHGEEGGLYRIDFNRAYNPYCAYGAPERFVCPTTPEENRLSLAITAGERGYHHREPGP